MTSPRRPLPMLLRAAAVPLGLGACAPQPPPDEPTIRPGDTAVVADTIPDTAGQLDTTSRR
jgi:hypothetical protein